jgi:hypothetical protein
VAQSSSVSTCDAVSAHACIRAYRTDDGERKGAAEQVRDERRLAAAVLPQQQHQRLGGKVGRFERRRVRESAERERLLSRAHFLGVQRCEAVGDGARGGAGEARHAPWRG